MMSSTTNGPRESPVEHTCLWRTSNPTLGNTITWCVFISLCVYACICTCLHNASGSVIHSVTHGSHRKPEPELTNKLLCCKILLNYMWCLWSDRCLGYLAVAWACLFMLGCVYINIPSSHNAQNMYLVWMYVCEFMHTCCWCWYMFFGGNMLRYQTK